MKEAILQAYARLECDGAKSTDQTSGHSRHSAEYLRMRSAIAEIVQPRRILAVGTDSIEITGAYARCASQPEVRCVDFKSNEQEHQSPRFIDVADRNGSSEAIGVDWSTEKFDLIHLSSQLDERQIFDLLVMAVRISHHIVIDGYFSAPHSRDAVNDFVWKFSEDIESVQAISGPGDVMVIAMNRSKRPDFLPSEPGSAAIRQLYTSNYYLENCGGFEFFQASRDRIVEDGRLRSMADLLFLRPGERVLDLGTGRGELACLAGWSGARVTAVDYSESAIRILRETISRDADLTTRVECFCSDVTNFEPEGKFDVVIAGDLVEHLAPNELERLYSRVSGWLNPQGIFIVHTFPNRWFYDYDYPRQVRAAQQLGARLPANPRSRFELLMHINEQSPRVLRRSLKRHFSDVKLWFGSPSEPAGSLLRTCSPRQLAGYRDLYAIASCTPINLQPERLFVTIRLQRFEFPLSIVACPESVSPGTNGFARVRVTNEDQIAVLASRPPFPVHLSYRWYDSTGKAVLGEGWRNLLVPALLPGCSHVYTLKFVSPSQPGVYQLIFSLVQEHIFWLCDVRRDLCPALTVTVK